MSQNPYKYQNIIFGVLLKIMYVCQPCMYAVCFYVCTICMYYMYSMYVLYVCSICMYYMYVVYVCSICVYYMNVSYHMFLIMSRSCLFLSFGVLELPDNHSPPNWRIGASPAAESRESRFR